MSMPWWFTALCTVYAVVLVIVGAMFVKDPFREDPRHLLIGAIFYTYSSLHWLMWVVAWWRYGRPPGSYVVCGMGGLLSAITLLVAQMLWDEWRRRRKGRPARAYGRLAVRLRRLVVVPIPVKEQ